MLQRILILFTLLLTFQSHSAENCHSLKAAQKIVKAQDCQVSFQGKYSLISSSICQRMIALKFSKEIYKPQAQEEFCLRSINSVKFIIPSLLTSGGKVNRPLLDQVLEFKTNPFTGKMGVSINQKQIKKLNAGCLSGFDARERLHELQCLSKEIEKSDLWRAIGDIQTRIAQ